MVELLRFEAFGLSNTVSDRRVGGKDSLPCSRPNGHDTTKRPIQAKSPDILKIVIVDISNNGFAQIEHKIPDSRKFLIIDQIVEVTFSDEITGLGLLAQMFDFGALGQQVDSILLCAVSLSADVELVYKIFNAFAPGDRYIGKLAIACRIGTSVYDGGQAVRAF